MTTAATATPRSPRASRTTPSTSSRGTSRTSSSVSQRSKCGSTHSRLKALNSPALGREDCILVGHDWGGGIGYGFCDRYPEMVRAFVVCNCPHYKALRQAQSSRPEQILKSWYMAFFQVSQCMLCTRSDRENPNCCVTVQFRVHCQALFAQVICPCLCCSLRSKTVCSSDSFELARGKDMLMNIYCIIYEVQIQPKL